MPFQPKVNDQLTISDVVYRTAEHPEAPGMPYGQEGRQATVFQLVTGADGRIYELGEKPKKGQFHRFWAMIWRILRRKTTEETPGSSGMAVPPQDLHTPGADRRALKVFKPRYRLPEMVSLAERIAPLAGLSGLQVCQRIVLTPQRHAALLRQHPDLTYAVLMPWVLGPTWTDVIGEKRALSARESLALARGLAEILAGMEQRRLAHCDLSGPNVILPALVQPATDDWRPAIALVDVEQLYGPEMDRPESLPGGSPGYAHKTAPQGLWGSTADRFSGTVLLGEILGWCDERVREAAGGENYFDPQEMQRDSERFEVLTTVLGERWGEHVAGLFERAWRSEVLADCATFGEWLVTLPEEIPEVVLSPQTEVNGGIGKAASDTSEAAARVLLEVGQRLEEQGNPAGALENYRRAQTLAPAASSLAEELRLILESLDAGQSAADRVGLDALFDDGLAAYRREEWAEAKELLTEVVRRQPNYERDGQRASDLLEEAEEETAPSRPPVPGWAWMSAMKNTLHFARDLTGSAQEIPCANASNPLGRPKITQKRAPFFIAAWMLGGLTVLALVLGVRMAIPWLWPGETAVPASEVGGSGDLLVSDRGGKREVYRLGRAGVEQVTHTPGDGESWSPILGSGGTIHFTSDRDGKREVCRLDGTGVVRVTHTPGDGESWSPSPGLGGAILFTSDRGGKREVYRLGRAGVEQVTHTPGGGESWSPILGSGGTIHFTSDRDGKREVYRLNRTGVVRVTHTPADGESWMSSLE